MTHSHGRCRSADRLGAKVSYDHWKTPPRLTALPHDRITAQCGLNGAINERSPCPYRTVSGSKAQSWRHRRALQSQQPQGRSRSQSHSRRWCLDNFSAATLQSRSQSNRTGLCQTRDPAMEDRFAATCKRIGSLLKCFSAQECAN